MKKEHFDLLSESMQQALDHKRGNRMAARSVVRVIDIPEYKPEEIASVRLKLNLTQRGLAQVVGVSPWTVEAWEAGANRPNGAARHLLYLLSKDESMLNNLLKA